MAASHVPGSGGCRFVDEATGALTPPLVASSTYLRDPDNAYRRGFSYGRDDNPVVRQAELMLAELEGGPEALLFASGMAAATAVFQALRPGDHLVAPQVMYWGLRSWRGLARASGSMATRPLWRASNS